jgi:hypothetical protein
MAPRAVRPLSRATATGNGVPSTEDLIQTQNAILQSNASVLGAVKQMRDDVGERLGKIDGKLDGVCADVASITEARAIESAIAGERDKTAVASAKVAESHVLSTRWRATLALAATTGLGSLLIQMFVALGKVR